MIEFATDPKLKRPDIIAVCKNCHEIAAPHFTACPTCGKDVQRRVIMYYKGNTNDKMVPIFSINRDTLEDLFIPWPIVEKLTDDDIVNIAAMIGNEFRELLTVKTMAVVKNYLKKSKK